ncbi:hypothetical protein K1719_022030 [Acacia pycnantha]|nr:hypothetical protein K1719_022030 [Acacia pycnantha]
MGGGPPSFNPFTRFSFFFFILYTTILLLAAAAASETSSSSLASTVDDDGAGKNPPPLPPLGSQIGGGERESPLKPTVAILIGVFTTLFFITFVFLLCVRQCKPEEEEAQRNSHTGGGHLGRKNSGIDRVVIESLPIFRFGSLRGQKEGLECAVCLTQFETVEVLRLLPKCKHAFHVECVDTWLDAHSTCPLCRYRVDPEDILLVGDPKVWPHNNQPIPPIQEISEDPQHCPTDIETGLGPDSQDRFDSNSLSRRVSGRHSSVGERSGGFFKILLQRRNSMDGETTTRLQKKTAPSRMSLDSAMSSTKRKRNETGIEKESGECEGPRKDGLLLTEKEKKHRLEHRIIVSPSQKSNEIHERWSDVQPSELLYLTSEMILSESCSSSGQLHSGRRQNMQPQLNRSRGANRTGAINERSLSEITGLSRTRRGEGGHRREEEEEREAGVLSRWGAWISQARRSRSVR